MIIFNPLDIQADFVDHDLTTKTSVKEYNTYNEYIYGGGKIISTTIYCIKQKTTIELE